MVAQQISFEGMNLKLQMLTMAKKLDASTENVLAHQNCARVLFLQCFADTNTRECLHLNLIHDEFSYYVERFKDIRYLFSNPVLRLQGTCHDILHKHLYQSFRRQFIRANSLIHGLITVQ